MHLSPSAPSCFIEPPVGMVTEVMRCHMKFQHPEGDHFTLINIYNTFKRSQKEPCEHRSSSHECPGEERECVKHLCVCVCVSDFSQEQWCEEYFLCCAALQTADAIRAQLTDILKRIELPISEAAFGTKTNALNIKRALLAGYFMQVWKHVFVNIYIKFLFNVSMYYICSLTDILYNCNAFFNLMFIYALFKFFECIIFYFMFWAIYILIFCYFILFTHFSEVHL